jgi:hypothetical protein
MSERHVILTGPDGSRWSVPYLPSKQRARTGLGNARGGDASAYVRGLLAQHAGPDGTVRCAACGAVCGVGRGVAATLADGRPTYLPAAEADRVLGDSEGWSVDAASLPYAPATVLPVCPAHNGDERARAPYRAALDEAGRALLAQHARPLD